MKTTQGGDATAPQGPKPRPPKPTYRFNYNELPAAFAAIAGERRFLVWKYIERGTSWQKLPIDPRHDKVGSISDPETWGTAAEAIAYARRKRSMAGVAVVLTRLAEHPDKVSGKITRIAGGDIDHCITDSGSRHAVAAESVDHAETYMEVSPSGVGIRLIFLDPINDAVKCDDVGDGVGVELYGDGRMLTITGAEIEESAGEIRTAPLAVERMKAAVAAATPKDANGHHRNGRHQQGNGKERDYAPEDFFANVKEVALSKPMLAKWVPILHPTAKRQPNGAWRVRAIDIGYKGVTEDLAYHPKGIKFFGTNEPFSAIDAVIRFGAPKTPREAAFWLCQHMGIAPATLGWRENEGEEEERVEIAIIDPPPSPSSSIILPPTKPIFPPTSQLKELIALFNKWLLMPDPIPLYGMLGTIGANLLPGDPVWTGLVAPPSSAKTEYLNSTSKLAYVSHLATVTPAALLSGSAKKDKAKGATGGVLKQIGPFGILCLKDFGSVLSMRPDAKAETLAAMREIYDGKWQRALGTDGGRVLEWEGKCGLVLGVTPAIDSHHGVMAQMGERINLIRMPEAGKEQLAYALRHSGRQVTTMRGELAEAVAGLLSTTMAEPPELTDEEKARLIDMTALAVRMRSAVERDRHSRELENIHGAEGPARFGLTLKHTLDGLYTIGLDRETSLQVIERIANDSVPPLRRKIFNLLRDRYVDTDVAERQRMTGPEIAEIIGFPPGTVQRVLEDLAAYRLVRRTGKRGNAITWQAVWDTPDWVETPGNTQ